MRHLHLGLLLAIFSFFAQKSYSQDKFAILEPNTNFHAKGLHHVLNQSQDSLILKSKDLMHHVYSINGSSKREIDQYIRSYEAAIPLKDLSSGKHVFAVSYLQKKILFVVRVYDPNATYEDMRKETDVAVRNN